MTASGSVTVLRSLDNATDGGNAYGGLVQGTDGSFYGTAGGSGSAGGGTLFRITSTGTFTVLHAFDPNDSNDGAGPRGNLVQGSDGNFYGATNGGASGGIVFRITPSGDFTQAQVIGDNPEAGLIQGSDGSLYGTTGTGGNGKGSIFKVTPSPAFPSPVALTVPASVTHGASFTLGYAVANSGSTTFQRCFATNTGSRADWTGIKTASTTNTNVTLTAPATAGTYTYTLTCGGQETGFATLTVQ